MINVAENKKKNCNLNKLYEENTEKFLTDEIGKTFVRVLSDAGVYKDTTGGRRAFLRFIDSVNQQK